MASLTMSRGVQAHQISSRRGQMAARPFRAVAPRGRTSLAVHATTMVKDEVSNVEFALAQKFWEGEAFRCLGAGTRVKKIMIVGVKVYSAACYVEADRCAKELGVRERGGFFEKDGDFCDAIVDGAFNKVLLIRLLRDVEGQQFAEALDKSLVPRMQLADEMDKLEEFRNLFLGKKLSEGTEVALFWNVVGDLEVLVTPPQLTLRHYDQLKPELRVRSMALCRALFEVFLGNESVVPDARKVWAAGARSLLDSENVKRATRKSG